MTVDARQRSEDPAGRPLGQPVEKYGHSPSKQRYRCEKCGWQNIDEFHVEGSGYQRDARGYKVRGTHDEEGLACGGRCWPWVRPGTESGQADVEYDFSMNAAVEALGELGTSLKRNFRDLFKKS